MKGNYLKLGIVALVLALFALAAVPTSAQDGPGADVTYLTTVDISGNGITSGAVDTAAPAYGDTSPTYNETYINSGNAAPAGTPVRTPDIWPSGGSYVSNFGLYNGVLYTSQYTRQYYAMHR